MEKEDYKAAVKGYLDKIREINDMRRKLIIEYVTVNKKFNEGDRVKITGRKARYAFIAGIRANSSGDIEYIVHKEKKDGCPSMVKDYVRSDETIEAIQ